jgi:hypothetical protein
MKLKDILMQCTKEQLTSIAKASQMRGYSKLNKGALVDALSEKLLSDDMLQSSLSKLDSDGLDLIRSFADGNATGDFSKIEILTSLGYADAKNLSICDEIIAAAGKSNSAAPKAVGSVVDYCNAFAHLYGIIPLKNAFEIYSKHNDIAESDFIAAAKAASSDNWEIQNDSIVATDIIEMGNFDELLKEQGAIPFYSPSKTKLMRYSDMNYFENTNEFNALKDYLRKIVKAAEPVANNIADELQFACYDNNDIYEAMNFTFSHYILDLTEANVRKIVELVTALDYNTRKRVLRGHTQSEIDEANQNVFNDFVDMFHSPANAPQRKIGRNEPCPCGSGKKYKRCCGKNA